MNFGCTWDKLCKLWLGKNLNVIAEKKSKATTRAKSIVTKAFIESACWQDHIVVGRCENQSS